MESSINSDLKLILDQLQLTESVLPTAYLGVPISSGIKLWHLAIAHGHDNVDQVRLKFAAEYESKVLSSNLTEAEDFAIKAKALFPNMRVVNPALVSVRGWSQGRYRRAWKLFISSFVDQVVLAPDWEYSHGCVVEVLHAFRRGIPVFDVHAQRLSLEQVVEQLENARIRAAAMGLAIEFLDRVLDHRSSDLALLPDLC